MTSVSHSRNAPQEQDLTPVSGQFALAMTATGILDPIRFERQFDALLSELQRLDNVSIEHIVRVDDTGWRHGHLTIRYFASKNIQRDIKRQLWRLDRLGFSDDSAAAQLLSTAADYARWTNYLADNARKHHSAIEASSLQQFRQLAKPEPTQMRFEIGDEINPPGILLDTDIITPRQRRAAAAIANTGNERQHIEPRDLLINRVMLKVSHQFRQQTIRDTIFTGHYHQQMQPIEPPPKPTTTINKVRLFPRVKRLAKISLLIIYLQLLAISYFTARAPP